MRGLTIESAEYLQSGKTITMTTKLSSLLPTIILRWVKNDKHGGNGVIE